jgi:hypothetical protein
MKEALSSSETSILTRATRRNNPEDTILQTICTYERIGFRMDGVSSWCNLARCLRIGSKRTYYVVVYQYYFELVLVVRVSTCACVYAHVLTYNHIFLHTNTSIIAYMHTYINACIYIPIYIFMVDLIASLCTATFSDDLSNRSRQFYMHDLSAAVMDPIFMLFFHNTGLFLD